LEKQFNIKLVGIYFPEAEYMARNLAIDELQAVGDNGEFWCFHKITNDISFLLSEIRYALRTVIFKNEAIADFLIDRVAPIGFVDGGISDGLPISKDDFEKFLSEISWADETHKYKLIYYFDVVALLDDFANHFINIGHRFLAVEYDLHKYLTGILGKSDPFPKLGGSSTEGDCEYMIGGWITLKIHQLYMDCIIGLYSLLDVFSKVVFELYNLPKEYTRVVKLNSNGRYFTDLENLSVPNEGNLTYQYTIFNKLADYKEISILRNEFVHRSSLSPLPKVFYGKGTDIVGSQPICYACCFLWDIDDNGNPIRWKNRHRFYSQKTLVDHYVLEWTKRVTDDLYCSIKYLKEHMDIQKGLTNLELDVDASTIIPTYRGQFGRSII